MFHRDLLKIDLGDKYNVLKKGEKRRSGFRFTNAW